MRHVLTVEWRTKPGAEAAVLAVPLAMKGPTSEEPGNLRFEVNVDPEDPRRSLLYEEYAYERAHAAHQATGYFKELVLGRAEPNVEWERVSLYRPLRCAGKTSTGGSMGEEKMEPQNGAVTVLVRMRARPESADELLAAFEEYLPRLRARGGLSDFAVHRGADDLAEIMEYEVWESQEALEAAQRLPLLAEFLEKIEPLLAGPVEPSTWRPVGGR